MTADPFAPLVHVRVRGFRSIGDASFRPGPLSAVVGEASAGKSNLLAAIRSLLDPSAAPLGAADASRDGDGTVRIEGGLADGTTRVVQAIFPGSVSIEGPAAAPPLFLPTSLRAGRVVAPTRHPAAEARRAAEVLKEAIPRAGDETDDRGPATESARGLVSGLESCVGEGLSGLVLVIEEPELFLPPQTQRYLYRLLRAFASNGNQVVYSTQSPAFLNVARLHELVLAERTGAAGTTLLQPKPLPADEEFRAFSEFDATRGELFVARAAVLVEGLTEKLTLPFVFEALGYDADRERISIVECGGKGNLLLFARVSRAVGVPFIAVHDRDAPAGSSPSDAERQLNASIAEVTGDRRVELAPDFEGVAGLRGHRHKPARAWRSFKAPGGRPVPAPLAEIVERAVALARR
jgi:hypothetical protein